MRTWWLIRSAPRTEGWPAGSSSWGATVPTATSWSASTAPSSIPGSVLCLVVCIYACMSGCVVVNNAWRSLNKKIASHRKILFQSILILLIFSYERGEYYTYFFRRFCVKCSFFYLNEFPSEVQARINKLAAAREKNKSSAWWLIAQFDRDICLNYINLILPERKKPPLYHLNHHKS